MLTKKCCVSVLFNYINQRTEGATSTQHEVGSNATTKDPRNDCQLVALLWSSHQWPWTLYSLLNTKIAIWFQFVDGFLFSSTSSRMFVQCRRNCAYNCSRHIHIQTRVPVYSTLWEHKTIKLEDFFQHLKQSFLNSNVLLNIFLCVNNWYSFMSVFNNNSEVLSTLTRDNHPTV